MNVLAKSSISFDQVNVKKQIGCDGLEYQLLKSDFNDSRELVDWYSYLKILDENPADAIHLPMANCNIEDEIYKELESAFQLADYSRLVWSRRGKDINPIIVTHNETHFEDLESRRKGKITYIIDELLDNYPNINLVIENTTPFRYLPKGKSLLSSGYYDSPVLYADYLRETIGTDRIGTCLDLCHAKISNKFMQPISDAYKDIDIDYSLDSYFSMYKDTLKLFHFASIEGSGYGEGHATPYTDDKRNELKRELELYKQYGLNCPITLEINEEDLLKCDGYRISKQNLDYILNGD